MRPVVKPGTWNVRTVTSGLSSDLLSISAARTTAVMYDELLRLKVDFVAPQETRLVGTGILRGKTTSFFGKEKVKRSRESM